MALQPFVGSWLLLQFRNPFYTDDRTPWTSDQSVARPLPTHGTTETQTSMPPVEFDPTIPEFDRAATVIGSQFKPEQYFKRKPNYEWDL
jgi:hypothetical protein